MILFLQAVDTQTSVFNRWSDIQESIINTIIYKKLYIWNDGKTPELMECDRELLT